MRKTLLFVICLMLFGGVYAQNSNNFKPATVSMIEETHINAAMQVLEHFSVEESGKKLLNLATYNGNINVSVRDLPWRKALELIALQNSLEVEEGVGYIALKDKVEIDEAAKLAEEQMQDPKYQELQKEVQAKQIRIKALAMLADRSYLKSLGVDWSTVAKGKVTLNAGFSGASTITSPFSVGLDAVSNVGKYTVDLNTLIRTIESDQKGSILAEPSVLVSSGKTGHIQVGQDISVKTADEAGNTLDTFFSTGIIMDVTPTLVELNGEDLIMMKVSIERSSGQPSAVSTIITKSTSSTELIMYDGEETVIAGLFDTDEVQTRVGIPILKDLPWWVFGIRYLTGYDSVERKERELIITIKAEVIDTALNRLLGNRAETIEEGKTP